MKILGMLAILLCNVLAFLLAIAAAFVIVRYTAWSNWAAASSKS